MQRRNYIYRSHKRILTPSVKTLQGSLGTVLESWIFFTKSSDNLSSREHSLPLYDARIHIAHVMCKASMSTVSNLQNYHPVFFLTQFTQTFEIQTYKFNSIRVNSIRVISSTSISKNQNSETTAPHFISLHECFQSITEAKVKQVLLPAAMPLKLITHRFVTLSMVCTKPWERWCW